MNNYHETAEWFMRLYDAYEQHGLWAVNLLGAPIEIELSFLEMVE